MPLHLLGPEALSGDALAQPILESKGQDYGGHTNAFHTVLQEGSTAPTSPSMCTCNSPPGASISLHNKHKTCSGDHSTNSSEDQETCAWPRGPAHQLPSRFEEQFEWKKSNLNGNILNESKTKLNRNFIPVGKQLLMWMFDSRLFHNISTTKNVSRTYKQPNQLYSCLLRCMQNMHIFFQFLFKINKASSQTHQKLCKKTSKQTRSIASISS